jgi:hypothetical protein
VLGAEEQQDWQRSEAGGREVSGAGVGVPQLPPASTGSMTASPYSAAARSSQVQR